MKEIPKNLAMKVAFFKLLQPTVDKLKSLYKFINREGSKKRIHILSFRQFHHVGLNTSFVYALVGKASHTSSKCSLITLPSYSFAR